MTSTLNHFTKPRTILENMDFNLPLARYRLKLRANTRIIFNDYSGSAWRGLFGHTLKRSVCVTQENHCNNCLLQRQCVYSTIFETPPPADTKHMRLYNAVPHPFVLAPDPALRQLNPGETTYLSLTLIGKANTQLPYIVHSFNQAGESGIGPARGRFELVSIEQELVPGENHWQVIYKDGKLNPLPAVVPIAPPLENDIALLFQIPVRLKYQSRLMNPKTFNSAGIISNLLRRVSSLSYFHGDGELQADFKALSDAAKNIHPIETDLNWYDWTRYSSRQQQKMQMGGFVGSAEFKKEAIETFWQLLWLGQWLHLGKATSMGLGRYRISEIKQIKDQAA